jgi:hypothetical protein
MQPFSCISVVGGRYLLNLQACAMFANSAVDEDRQNLGVAGGTRSNLFWHRCIQLSNKELDGGCLLKSIELQQCSNSAHSEIAHCITEL